MREVDGWVYSSLPLEAAVGAGEIVIRRLRQTVSPAGELTEEPERGHASAPSPPTQLEAEAAEAGLVAARAPPRSPPTDVHVGSTVVVLGKAG